MTFDLHRVLFVCTYNSVRSPMAAAILNAIAGERYTAESAGLFPSPVDSGVVAVMREKGIDLSSHQPRSLGACSETAYGTIIFSLLRCGSVPTTSLPQKRLTS
jgi:arsenate reductase (thioredoxin)